MSSTRTHTHTKSELNEWAQKKKQQQHHRNKNWNLSHKWYISVRSIISLSVYVSSLYAFLCVVRWIESMFHASIYSWFVLHFYRLFIAFILFMDEGILYLYDIMLLSMLTSTLCDDVMRTTFIHSCLMEINFQSIKTKANKFDCLLFIQENEATNKKSGVLGNKRITKLC